MEAPYSFCNSIKVINDIESTSQQNSLQNQNKPKQPSQDYLKSQSFLRWHKQSSQSEDIETYLSRKYMQFRKFKFNIFILQRSALKIQHWFFKIKYNLDQKQLLIKQQQEQLENERQILRQVKTQSQGSQGQRLQQEALIQKSLILKQSRKLNGSKEQPLFLCLNSQPSRTLYSNEILKSVRKSTNVLQKSIEKLYERKGSPRDNNENSTLERSFDRYSKNQGINKKKAKQNQIVQIDLNPQQNDDTISQISQNKVFMTKQPSLQMVQKDSERNLIEYLDLSSPSPIKVEYQHFDKVSPLIKLQNCVDETSLNDSLVNIKDSNFNSEDEKQNQEVKTQVPEALPRLSESTEMFSPDSKIIIRSNDIIKSHANLSKQLQKQRGNDSSMHRSVSNPRDLLKRKTTINETLKNPPQFKILKINLPQKHNFQNRQATSNLRASINSLDGFSQTINPRNKQAERKSSLSSSFILNQSSFIQKQNESVLQDQNPSGVDSSRKNNYLKSIQHKYLSKSKQKQIMNRSLDFSFISLSQTINNNHSTSKEARANRDQNNNSGSLSRSQNDNSPYNNSMHKKSVERLESVSQLNKKFEDEYIERLGNMRKINEKFISDQVLQQ
ncbi:UNKNOWN [Stylonychia lemnae]|uniref:Uncharacterized protein n=1 Tax=Stylonychia lemnae TaxID=5949 RepID=A0A078A1R1_STYLE|nr:UNKNOWN [Stylonychia lemnae]|eukprot:CDW75777.1 UNKNOWN [Stylonychia lemnae]